MQVNLSKFILELFEISGMTEQEFCEKLNITKEQFDEIKSGGDEKSASVKTFLKAIAFSVFSKSDNQKSHEMSDNLTKAQAIVLTIGESQSLEEHEQTTLSVASDLIDSVRQNI